MQGQAIDLAATGRSLSESQLRDMHERKTGLLLRASVQMGAACGSPNARSEAALCTYGSAIGLAFQVVDDILDTTQDSATLGKTAGKDEEAGKPTYVSVMGLEASRRYAARLRDEALAALDGAPDSEDHRTHVELADDLAIIAEYLEALRSSICPRCQAIELIEGVKIEPP